MDCPIWPTGSPGARSCTGSCSGWGNCCCMTREWVSSCWRSLLSEASSFTAISRGAAGLLWWSECVVDEIGHTPAHLQDLRVGARGIHPVRQQNNEEVAVGIHPDGCAREAGMSECVRSHFRSGARVFGGCVPAERSAGARRDVLAPGEFEDDPRRQLR